MEAKRICLIEDDAVTQKLILTQLSSWYQITAVNSIREAAPLLNAEDFDLILLDVTLPDGNGFEFCASLRGNPRTKDVPIIFVTGRDSPLDKMMGFSLGADDYLIKPFEPIEAKARIDARLRKRSGPKITEDSVTIGFVRFDSVKQRAFSVGADGERDMQLTPFEFKLLYYLALRAGQFFTRSALMKRIMEPGVHVNEGNLYTHISSVRKKLGPLADQLESVPRIGYRFVASDKKPQP